MASIQHLTGLELVASGFLRILAGYLLFLVLARLNSRPRIRHALWLFFLIAASFYWAILLAQVLKPQPFTNIATHSAATGAPAKITLRFRWDQRLELAAGGLLWAYAGGLILMLVRFARRRRSLRQALAKARPAEPGIVSTFETECRRLGISRCRIVEFPGLSSPGTAYTWKPVVLIPEDLASYLDSEQFIDVLYHELMHVRRLDFLWGTLGDFACCLLFFHPAVWLAVRHLGHERELACDQTVMELRHGRRTGYATCLARLARRRVLGSQLDPPSHLALLNSFLAFRVQTLLSENRRRSGAMQGVRVSASLIALFVFFAGWSSLSLAIELAPTLKAGVSLAKGGHLPTASQKQVARPVKAQRTVEGEIPPQIPVTDHDAPPIPDGIRSLPASGGDIDAWIVSPQIGAGGSLTETRDQSAWDEAPPRKPVTTLPSWRRTVMDAAIGALGRVAQGRRPDDKD
jgi:beta-lactamase regulating signal transducer with metallopeptidase domain